MNRITLHKNFFLSLILHSVAQIIWESIIMKTNVTNSASYVEENNVNISLTFSILWYKIHKIRFLKIGCIFINVLLNYTRASNYFWMLCESLYLHQLLVTVFKDPSSLLLFYLIGWGKFKSEKFNTFSDLNIKDAVFQTILSHSYIFLLF